MLRNEDAIEQIKEKFAIFKAKIELETSLNHHNLKLYGENFFRDLLNILDDEANFQNTNFSEEANFSAVDLVSDKRRKCIQITSNRQRTKIEETLEKFRKLPYMKFFKIYKSKKYRWQEKERNLIEYRCSFNYIFKNSHYSKYLDYDVEIYYLLNKTKPSNIEKLEQKYQINDLSSKLKDSTDLLKKIDNLNSYTGKFEQVLKLFKIEETFINNFEKAIKSIEEEISEVEIPLKFELNGKLIQTRDYFKTNLDLLFEILKQIDCETETHKKNFNEKYFSMVRFLNFIIMSKQNKTSKFFLPNHQYNDVFINNYKSWLFNSVKSSMGDKKIDFHIGKIASYLSLNNNLLDGGVCFITSLKDYGGLDCNTCTNGLLESVPSRVDKVFQNIMDGSTNQTITFNHYLGSFIELKKGKKIDFKCGQCISRVDECDKVRKIL